nr:GTPase HflX [Gracilibacillus phocaeensis]
MIIERVLLLAVLHQKLEEASFFYSLEELQALVTTVQGTVVDTVVQKRQSRHRKYYIGEGKLEQITALVEEEAIDVVIANEELSGAQIRNLQDHLAVRVIDRSQLILDIFASRAQTKEGKLQVELAQYDYMLPRLHGQGSQLSRLGGGIGTRGPGETQLETDQRHIRNRMDDIKRRLKQVVNQREQYRENRRRNQLFQVAVVGYTNAGKSTLFNQLTKSESLQEDQLFATLDPLSRKMVLPSNMQIVVTDTVGFIQDLPTSLVAAFRSTLEEVTEADLILHVMDVHAPNREEQAQTVDRLLTELGADQVPALTLFNKKDLIDPISFVPSSYPYLLVSAFDEQDIQKIKQKVEDMMKEGWAEYSGFLPEQRADKLARIRQNSILTEETYNEALAGYYLKGFVDPEHAIMKEIKELQKE